MTRPDRHQSEEGRRFLEQQEREFMDGQAESQFHTEESGAISPSANHSAALRAEPPAASQAKPAAVIARIEAMARALAEEDGRPATADPWLKRDVYMREARRIAAAIEAYHRFG